MEDLHSEGEPVAYGQFMFPSPQEIIEAHLVYMAASFSKNTVDDVRRVIRYAHGKLPNGLPRATREELTAFLARDDWSNQTKSTYRQHIRRFFAWACDEDDPWLSLNPALRLRRPKVGKGVPRPATEEQTRAAVTLTAMPFQLHCRLAAYAGFRCIEVARLRREDMDRRDIRIFGKGDKPAVVPMHPAIWRIVEGMPDGPVTTNTRGQAATAHWVSDRTAYHLHQLGIPISMHRLRARYVTMIQRLYKDATVTQRLARHESLNTTQGYVLVADEAAYAAVAMLPDLTD